MMDDDWEVRAACRGAVGDLFFPGRGATEQTRDAKAVCARCPVREDCLERFLGERYGVWGGMTERERMRERKRRLLARRDAA